MRQAQALEGSKMRIARDSMLLAAIVVGTLISNASPVLAQTQEQPRSAAAMAQNAADSPDYALQDDGTVIIGGDNATDCRSFALYLDNPNYEPPGSLRQARDVSQQCKEQGTAGPVDTELSDTGGPPVLPTAGSLLAGTGLVIHCRIQWQ